MDTSELHPFVQNHFFMKSPSALELFIISLLSPPHQLILSPLSITQCTPPDTHSHTHTHATHTHTGTHSCIFSLCSLLNTHLCMLTHGFSPSLSLSFCLSLPLSLFLSLSLCELEHTIFLAHWGS